MRIVITFPLSLGAPGGGTEGCIQIARHIQLAGAKVLLLPVFTQTHTRRYPRLQTPETTGCQQEKALKKHGIEIIRVSPHPAHFWLDGLPVKNTLKTILAKKQIDAVIGWHQEVLFLPKILRSKKVFFGMIAAGSFKASNPDRRRKILIDYFVGRSMRKADVIFAASHYMCDEIRESFNVDTNKFVVAHWGVDPMFVNPNRSVSEKITRLIFFGWLIPEKGIFETLEALSRVANQGWRDWTLKLAGWGDVESVKEVARKKGIPDNIVFLGRLDHPSLARELAWAQLAILPSHAEAFGLANAEAQASGMPVIAYDVGAVPEVIKNNVTGWLVPEGNIDLLTDAILEAFRDPEKTFQMGLAGQNRITKLFTWGQTANTIINDIENTKGKTI
ncbi:MAG: glycosyltransferase family 4 protein [Anaerolineales bacterium]